MLSQPSVTRRKGKNREAVKVVVHEAARNKHVLQRQVVGVNLDLRVRKVATSNTRRLRLRSTGSRITSLVDHKTSLRSMSSLDRANRISMHSNVATMVGTNRPTV
jgi:RNA 3'-terminal phosphate cyclase